MTTISAQIIKDSVSQDGIRLTTMHLRYPRFIHAELMTHRDFSRNARSSRAVPVAKMIQEIIDNPVVPLFWGKNQKGMQASQECNEPIMHPITKSPWPREDAWLLARYRAVEIARAFMSAGYHKQVVNRLLEPFMHIDVLVSSTNWSNFFALRDHDDAEPHIQVLAREMRKAMDVSKPNDLLPGMWHLPYTDDRDLDILGRETAIKLSVARCARISYAPFDGDASIESELRRYDTLVGSQPLHASPAEHQATPDVNDGKVKLHGKTYTAWSQSYLHGNFTGWCQYRKLLPNECVKEAA
ncbi:MAG: FAD-dependent thymidylate synthase [Rhizobiaceae bacterium]|nr:FAD-dependent thymidylate synthase [Rhizobiaceae bacterium]